MTTPLAADYELAIDQGATFERTVEWHDADGAVVDLTGYTAAFGIYASRTSAALGGAALLSLSEAAGLTLGGTAGTIDIELTAAQTAGLTFLTGYYLLKLTLSGTVTRLMEGTARMNRGV
jgi:hypothetical protein